MVVAIPMMFLSGATIPLEVMPAGVGGFSKFIPLTHAIRLPKGLWFIESVQDGGRSAGGRSYRSTNVSVGKR